MSAFVCSDKHLSAIVRWASINNLAVAGLEQEAVELLHAENVKSVNYHYQKDEPAEGGVYLIQDPVLSAVEVIKACDCLDYQSCEHSTWRESEACKLLERIKGNAISRLPGYDEAKWGIE